MLRSVQLILCFIALSLAAEGGVLIGVGLDIPRDVGSVSNDYYYKSGWMQHAGGFADLKVGTHVGLRSQLLLRRYSYDEKFAAMDDNFNLTTFLVSFSWWRIELGEKLVYKIRNDSLWNFGSSVGLFVAKTSSNEMRLQGESSGSKFNFDYYAPLATLGIFGSYKRFELNLDYTWMLNKFNRDNDGLYPLINDVSLTLGYRIL